MPKIYLHYEGGRGPEHTFVWRQPRSGECGASLLTGRRLKEALDGFVASYHKRHGPEGAAMDAARLKLVAVYPTLPGRSITLDTTSDEPVDPELLPHGADVKVEDVPKTAAAAAAPAQQPRRAVEKAMRAPAAEDAEEARLKANKIAAKAEKLVAKQNLRGARDLLKEAIELDRRNRRALRCLARVYEKAGLAEAAFEAAKDCCSSARDSGPVDFLRAGRCLMELGRHAEARTVLLRARAEGKGSVLDDVDAALARCTLNLGDGPGAANMYMQVLQRTGEQHLEALVGYGRLAMLVNQAEKGVPSLLKAVVINQNHEEARKVLAEALGIPEGMSALKAQLAPAPDSSSVYSFLGTITKDHGEIDASLELLSVAATIDPRSASYALSLLHGHEVAADNAGALAVAKEYLSRNSTKGIGNAGAGNIDVLRVLQGLPNAVFFTNASLTPSPELDLRGVVVNWTTLPREQTPDDAPAWTEPSTSDAEDVSFAWCSCAAESAAECNSSDGRKGADGGAMSGEGECGESDANADPNPTKGDGTEASPRADSGDGAVVQKEAEKDAQGRAVYRGWLEAPRGARKEVYSAEDLDVLAMHFAVVKILFLEGQWTCLPELLGILETTRMRSGMSLHRTNIRNEQAYYCCIAQLLSFPSRHSFRPVSATATDDMSVGDGDVTLTPAGELYPEKSGEPVYVCGDSHTLTPAWREISVRGRRRVLRPALVTGLKHWHLRPESNFYPKKNFEKVVKKIPDGSAVVLIFGEIDCREGLLLAVEKLRYDNLTQGAERTIGIFIKVAEDLARERGFKVYVHPVIPVLDETRGMVKMYNRVFRRMVRKSTHLHWLDFFDGLLDETGDNLRPEFKLDGTHLAPSYLALLEKSLEGVWVE